MVKKRKSNHDGGEITDPEQDHRLVILRIREALLAERVERERAIVARMKLEYEALDLALKDKANKKK